MEKVEMPKFFSDEKQRFFGAVIVAQLAKRPLPIPEVHGSNPDTGKFLKNIYLLSTVLYWKPKIKEK